MILFSKLIKYVSEKFESVIYITIVIIDVNYINAQQRTLQK